jgi:hypothetical protein
MDLALGEVGLDREVMLRMTWGDLWRTIYGYWIRQDREWDRNRTIVAMLYNRSRSKRQPYKPPHRIMPLAIDRMGVQAQEWTEEKYEKFDQALKAWGLDKKDGSTE